MIITWEPVNGCCFNHFSDAVTQSCQDMREVVGILPKAAIGMQNGTLTSTDLGKRRLWSMH